MCPGSSCNVHFNGIFSVSPDKRVPSLGPRISDPAKPTVSGTRLTKSSNGSLGVMVSEVTPDSIIWFWDPCILPIGNIKPYRGV